MSRSARASACLRVSRGLVVMSEPYFSKDSGQATIAIYGVLALIVTATSIVAVLAAGFGLLVQCDSNGQDDGRHPNPDYRGGACEHARHFVLLGMSLWECDMALRVLVSILCGSLIGLERRA